MLEHLVGESEPFFQQLEPLSKETRCHPAIAGAGLVPWIVRGARPKVVDSEEGQETGEQIGDMNALRILVEIAKPDTCKSAIAEGGGIATLVADYRLLKMSENAFDPIIVDVVGALAGLAEDAACREQFAAAHGEWTLLDFLWKCSTTRTWRYVTDELGNRERSQNVLGDWEDKTEFTSFNRATVLSTESKAGRALWTLAALGGDWKRRVLYLSTLYLESDGDRLDDNNPAALSRCEERYPQFDAVRGWLRMSNYIEEEQKHTKERTYWCVPIIWRLLMDEDTSFIAAEWYFGGNLCRRRCGESSDSVGTIFAVEAGKHPYIKWSLEALEGDASDEEYSDAESSDPESSDEDTSDEDASDDDTSISERDHEEDGQRQREEPSRAVLRAEKRKREKFNRAVLQALTHVELELISSTCSHLALPRDKCKRLSTCLWNVLRALEDDKTVQKAKALSVLWLCAGFMAIEPKDVDRLVKICVKAVAGGRADEVFWATCLLLSMLSSTRRMKLLELAANGVCVLLESGEWSKFVFLAKYLVVKELEDMGRACIPFLAASAQRIKETKKCLNDDSYFQSECYRRSGPIQDEELVQRCLEWLGTLWSAHKLKIVEEDAAAGAPVRTAMLECSKVKNAVKRDIKQALQAKAEDTAIVNKHAAP